MAQQRPRQAEAGDASEAHQQAQPAHRVDRLAEQQPGQKGHGQGLGINQHRAQGGARATQSLGEQALKQAAVHQGKQQQPGPIGRGHRQGTTAQHRH
jgi:hypothetical protein